MSVQWLSWVFEHADVSGGQRLVLLSLANHADDGGLCWPSKDTIAREARLSLRRVEDAVRGLISAGLLERTVNAAPVGGQSRPNLYRLNRQAGSDETSTPADSSPADSSRADDSSPVDLSVGGSDDSSFQGRTIRPPKPSVEPSVEPSGASDDAPPLLRVVDNGPSDDEIAAERFEQHFWPAWPRRHGRRNGKAAALRRWKKLSVTDQRKALRGAKAYAAHCQHTDTFPMDAERWLRDRLWEEWLTVDDPPQPTGVGSAAFLPNGGRVSMTAAERAELGITVGATP